ncbi:MAG: Pyridoxal 5'-phosphate synthase subunit PdxT [Chlamydiae bacterium]|nr:Pyridoxal 5'-phosphate synthase subunit PdxT [Chlamydiota bacterium]
MIGVLALQGAFQRHVYCLEKLNIPTKLVKTREDLKACHALVLPGGESTAHQKLISPGLWADLKEFSHSRPVMGTCCGLILLAKKVKDDDMPTLGALDILVARNAYGPQVESFEAEVEGVCSGKPSLIKGCFIRAPQILEVGPSVNILATYDSKPVLVEAGKILACTFHPELLYDLTVHRHFVEMVNRNNLAQSGRFH